MSFISIIIPTFNSEGTIQRLLEAFQNDSVQSDCEILVIDGCSKDRTVEICKQYKVKVFYNPKIHAAAARNIGIEHAKGEICAFIDSDCVPCKGWVDVINRLFAEDKNIIAVGGNMMPYPPKNRIEEFAGDVFINKLVCFSDNRLESFSNQVKHSFVTANCAYRTDILRELGGFNDFFSNNGEDLDLFWRAINSKKGRLIYEPRLVVQHSFPDTNKKLFLKYRQYGLAIAKLASRYSSIRFQVDWRFHFRFLGVLLTWLFRPRWNSFSVVYMSGFMWGKLIGSFKYHVICL